MDTPEWTKSWTLDEAAECLSFETTLEILVGRDEGRKQGRELYGKLWGLHNQAAKENMAPRGGDGSNGTAETPSERLEAVSGGSSDQLAKHWQELTEREQVALDLAHKKEYRHTHGV